MTSQRDGPTEPEPAPETAAVPLDDADRAYLLAMARRILEGYLGDRQEPETETDRPSLLEPRATFVTLRRKDTGELRGCRGEVLARRPLVESVARTAIVAAIDDPRFPPVTADELPDLSIEISVLTPPQPIRPDDVEVGRHGLMIRSGPYVGLLLPQVPVEQGWDREAYLRGLCLKAGLPPRAWQNEGVELHAFEAEVWGEAGER